jgi:hypothetical protein
MERGKDGRDSAFRRLGSFGVSFFARRDRVRMRRALARASQASPGKGFVGVSQKVARAETFTMKEPAECPKMTHG